MCVVVTAPEEHLCVTPAQVEACLVPAADGMCALDDVEYARCYDGVCLPAGCGNTRMDPGEVCDDGNDFPADGCSSDCRSNETCGNGITDAVNSELCDDGNRLAHDGCDGTCLPELPRWHSVGLTKPTPRQGASIAYDRSRGLAVMFGGVNDDATPVGFGETWTWDGLGWLKLTPTVSPSSRAWSAMAFDASRERVILFGGELAGTPASFSAETWEWDGTTWSLRVAATTPPARAHHTLVYDAARRRVVMFGGTNGTELADTWTWDGTTWTAVASTGPTARAGHSMGFDPQRGVSVLFGGRDAGGLDREDTWAFDGAAWTEISTTVHPSARRDSSIVYVPDQRALALYGGVAGANERALDLWTFDGIAWGLVPTQADPYARSGQSMTADVTRGRLVMFGGKNRMSAGPGSQTPFCTADTYELVGMTWTRMDATAMAVPPRYLHAMAFDETRRRGVMFGGTDGTTDSSETWEIRDDRAIKLPVTGPSARRASAMAYDATRHSTVLFGGISNVALGDTWRWNGAAWTNLGSVGAPSARSSHAMAFDASRGRVVLFGGVGSSALADTWEWNGTAWSNVTVAASPPARQQAVMGYDPIAKRVLLFGGRDDAGSFLNDTWLWDGASWTRQQPAAVPPRRARAAMAWNPARRRLVLVSGQSSTTTALNDAWEWNGVTWSPIAAPEVPSPRLGMSLMPASDGAGVVALGGAELSASGTPSLADASLWHLVWQGQAPDEGCRDAADHDGDTLSGCADPDCWTVCSPTCPPGTSCAGTRCGDGQCDAELESCQMCPGDCGECAPVCGDFSCGSAESATTCPGDC